MLKETKTLLHLEGVMQKSNFMQADTYVYYKSVEIPFKHPKRVFIDIRGCNRHYVDLEVINTFNAQTLLKKRVKFLNVARLKETIDSEVKTIL